MKRVLIPGALPPKGHYSPAIVDGGLVYVSGQLPVDPFTGEKCSGDIAEQAKVVFANFERVLEAAGSRKECVIKVVLYVSDIALWDEVNALYSEFFGDHYPVRSIVPVGPLHYGFKIEMEGIAKLSENI